MNVPQKGQIRQYLLAKGWKNPTIDSVTGVWKEQVSGGEWGAQGFTVASSVGPDGGQLGVNSQLPMPMNVTVTNPSTGRPEVLSVDMSLLSADEARELNSSGNVHAAYKHAQGLCDERRQIATETKLAAETAQPAPNTLLLRRPNMANKKVATPAGRPRALSGLKQLQALATVPAPVQEQAPAQQTGDTGVDVTYMLGGGGEISVHYDQVHVGAKGLALLRSVHSLAPQTYKPPEGDAPIVMIVPYDDGETHVTLRVTAFNIGLQFDNVNGYRQDMFLIGKVEQLG